MGHYLTALLTRLPIDEVKAVDLGLAVVFEGDVAIVPIVPESLDAWSRELDVKYEPYSRNIQVDCSVTHRLAALLGATSFALIETEYFGGTGTQCASYYEDSVKALNEVGINEVLRLLGVAKAQEMLDEFDTIGLGRYRKLDDDRFWNEDRYGQRIGNILVGKRRFKY